MHAPSAKQGGTAAIDSDQERVSDWIEQSHTIDLIPSEIWISVNISRIPVDRN
jgi:hypothetical protein